MGEFDVKDGFGIGGFAATLVGMALQTGASVSLSDKPSNVNDIVGEVGQGLTIGGGGLAAIWCGNAHSAKGLIGCALLPTGFGVGFSSITNLLKYEHWHSAYINGLRPNPPSDKDLNIGITLAATGSAAFITGIVVLALAFQDQDAGIRNASNPKEDTNIASARKVFGTLQVSPMFVKGGGGAMVTGSF